MGFQVLSYRNFQRLLFTAERLAQCVCPTKREIWTYLSSHFYFSPLSRRGLQCWCQSKLTTNQWLQCQTQQRQDVKLTTLYLKLSKHWKTPSKVLKRRLNATLQCYLKQLFKRLQQTTNLYSKSNFLLRKFIVFAANSQSGKITKVCNNEWMNLPIYHLWGKNSSFSHCFLQLGKFN